METQDRFFTRFNYERFIEVGPSPTLAGMATRTLNAKYGTKDDAVNRRHLIFYQSKDTKEIYHGFEDEAEEADIVDIW